MAAAVGGDAEGGDGGGGVMSLGQCWSIGLTADGVCLDLVWYETTGVLETLIGDFSSVALVGGAILD